MDLEEITTPPEELGEYVHRKLRIQLIIYFLIAGIVLGISVFHILTDHTNIILPAIGFIIAVFGGTFTSRINKIDWDHGAEKVISTFDALGVFVLICYIAFEVYREKIVEYFVHGPAVVAVSLAVLSGVMFGRVLGIRGRIRQVFREQKIIK